MIITGYWRKARPDNSIALRLLSNVIFYDEKASVNISATVINEPKRKVKQSITEDERNTSCDELKPTEVNYVPDNLPHVTPSRMPDQHSLTGSNISSGDKLHVGDNVRKRAKNGKNVA